MKHKWEKKERKHPNQRKIVKWAVCANCGVVRQSDFPMGYIYTGNGEIWLKAPVCESDKYKSL